MANPPLRAVGADERASGPRSMTVDVAAKDGTDLELLMSMRDRVAAAVANPNCPPRDLAALTRRLEEIRKQIAAEKAKVEEEAKDALSTPDAEWDAEAI